MKYYSRLKVFKSKRCEFDPHAMHAWSYGWWKFVACLDGKVYFNNASYSMQTSKQQKIIRDLLKALGVKFTYVYIKAGLHNIGAEIDDCRALIEDLRAKIARPRSRKNTNVVRLSHIKHLEKEIVALQKLQKARPTPYKGKLRFENIPKPTPRKRHKKATPKPVVSYTPPILVRAHLALVHSK